MTCKCKEKMSSLARGAKVHIWVCSACRKLAVHQLLSNQVTWWRYDSGGC